MKETGMVIQATKEQATIQLIRQSACGGNCAGCGACPYQTTKVNVENKLGAKAGDRVELELKTKQVYQAAFLVYILPLLCFFIAYFFMSYLQSSENLCIFAGLLAAIAVFFAVRRWSKKQAEKYMPRMTKIL